jgi:hypothetical protein
MTGLPQRSLQIVIHGFVFFKIYNTGSLAQFASFACPSQTQFSSVYRDFKNATPHNGLYKILHPD